jgi:hypothetical protein
MNCQYRMGLLTMRECGAPAAAGCAVCGTTICQAHMVMGQYGPACPQCAAANPGYQQNEDTELAAAREEYYRPYGGFGKSGFFSRGDAAALGGAAIGGAALGGAAFAAQPQQRPDYDPMET